MSLLNDSQRRKKEGRPNHIEEVLLAAFNQDRVAPAERDEPLATSTAS